MPNNDINRTRFSNRHRLLGDPAGAGAPQSALTAELAHNENDNILYIGTGNDGAGNATAIVPIAGEGHFSTRAYAESLTGGVQSSLDAEVTARQTAVSDLSSRVDAIVSNTDAAALDSLSEIVTAFQAADSDLDGAISALGTSATSALGAEVTRAQAAEAELASDISDEEDARIAADNLLAADITNLTSRANTNDTRSTAIETAAGIVEGRVSEAESDIIAIENAATALTGRVSTLESGLAAEITARTAAVSAEQTRAEAAESALADDIASETSAREAAISAEVTAREAAVSAEATARAAAISAETTAREAAISAVNTRVDNVLSNIDPVALDSLTEVVSAFQSADSSLTDAITNLTAGSAAAVAAEETRALAAEAALQTAIDNEVSARQTAISDLASEIASDIADEVTARTSDVQSVRDVTDNHETRLSSAEGTIAGLGTMSTQNSSNVSITGGSISGVNLQASSMEISGSGSTALYVGAAGKVGIGTEAPSTALDVVGSITVSQELIGSGTSVLRGFILGGGTF